MQGGRDNSSGYDSTDEEVGLSKSSAIGALKKFIYYVNLTGVINEWFGFAMVF